MKVVFISCYLSPHQIPFSNEMYKLLGDNYKFVSVEQTDQERLNMGWNIDENYEYEIKYYEISDKKSVDNLIDESDVVIIGSASDRMIVNRLKKGKLTFKYSERLYKEGLNIKNVFRAIISAWLHHGRYQKYNLYMLCASAYTAGDLAIFNNYIDRTYKWGYFPIIEKEEYNKIRGGYEKDFLDILWCGRLIGWKRPYLVLDIAKKLRERNIEFKIKILGDGYLRESLENKIKEENLVGNIEIINFVNYKKVNEYMRKSDILLVTSDFNEGWGAVVNEAMSTGGIVIASHSVGSVPFLIKDKENGFIYEMNNIDEAVDAISNCYDLETRQRISYNAYLTIKNKWNEEIAAKRFLELAKGLLSGKKIEFEDGPCSKAKAIKQRDMISYIKKGENK